jgi:hypothetical protein
MMLFAVPAAINFLIIFLAWRRIYQELEFGLHISAELLYMLVSRFFLVMLY